MSFRILFSEKKAGFREIKIILHMCIVAINRTIAFLRLGNIVGLVLSTSLWRYGTIKSYTVVFDNYPFPRNIQLYKRKCCVQYKWRMVNTCLLSCLFIHSYSSIFKTLSPIRIIHVSCEKFEFPLLPL